LFLKRRENTERERERENTLGKFKNRGEGFQLFSNSPLYTKNRKEVNEEEEDGESPVKIPVRAEKDRRVPRGRGDG
jgi:hypothetical protein